MLQAWTTKLHMPALRFKVGMATHHLLAHAVDFVHALHFCGLQLNQALHQGPVLCL